MLGKAAKQAKARNYPGTYGVNEADRWKERLRSYLGRPHRRVETEVRNAVEIRFVMRSQPKP
jgi:exonuclease I